MNTDSHETAHAPSVCLCVCVCSLQVTALSAETMWSAWVWSSPCSLSSVPPFPSPSSAMSPGSWSICAATRTLHHPWRRSRRCVCVWRKTARMSERYMCVLDCWVTCVFTERQYFSVYEWDASEGSHMHTSSVHTFSEDILTRECERCHFMLKWNS